MHGSRNDPVIKPIENIMRTKTIKSIAIRILVGAALHSSSFAGPATWVNRSASVAPSVTRRVTIAFFGHPIKQPYPGPIDLGATRLFNAGQGVVSVPE